MKRTLLLIPFLATISCSTDQESISDLNWMTGKWIKESDSPVTTSIEVWEKTSETEMTGYGLTMEDGDTIFYERLQIIEEDNELFYLADVGEGIVKFKLNESEHGKWAFENPEHDFPKRIIYTYDGTSMVAFAQADDVSLEFRFKKAD
ncbi:MAG: DUF6265 family protein [Cyclobacteriaceae bacterium]